MRLTHESALYPVPTLCRPLPEGKLMHHAQAADPEWLGFVRGALANLYDPAYLENQALALHLEREGESDRVTRAQMLRRILDRKSVV